jgi:hypothetical protein
VTQRDSITGIPNLNTRWFKYERDDLCVNKSQFVPVIFEPPCIFTSGTKNMVSGGQNHIQGKSFVNDETTERVHKLDDPVRL